MKRREAQNTRTGFLRLYDGVFWYFFMFRVTKIKAPLKKAPLRWSGRYLGVGHRRDAQKCRSKRGASHGAGVAGPGAAAPLAPP